MMREEKGGGHLFSSFQLEASDPCAWISVRNKPDREELKRVEACVQSPWVWGICSRGSERNYRANIKWVRRGLRRFGENSHEVQANPLSPRVWEFFFPNWSPPELGSSVLTERRWLPDSLSWRSSLWSNTEWKCWGEAVDAHFTH